MAEKCLADFGLKITDVRCWKVSAKKKFGVVGIAEVELNGGLNICSLRLYRMEDGEFRLQFPPNPQSRRGRAFSWVKTERARKELLDAVKHKWDETDEVGEG